MKRRNVLVYVLIAALVGVTAPTIIHADETAGNIAADAVPAMPLWAQVDVAHDGPFFQPPPGGPGDMGGRERQRKLKHLEQFRLLKLLEVLDLNEDQEVPFMTAFRAMRRQTRTTGLERRKALKQLEQALSEEQPAAETIYDLVAAIRHSDDSLRKIRDAFLQSARKTLTPTQFGKLIVFQEKFDTELLQAAGFIRRGRRGEGNKRNR